MTELEHNHSFSSLWKNGLLTDANFPILSVHTWMKCKVKGFIVNIKNCLFGDG